MRRTGWHWQCQPSGVSGTPSRPATSQGLQRGLKMHSACRPHHVGAHGLPVRPAPGDWACSGGLGRGGRVKEGSGLNDQGALLQGLVTALGTPPRQAGLRGNVAGHAGGHPGIPSGCYFQSVTVRGARRLPLPQPQAAVQARGPGAGRLAVLALTLPGARPALRWRPGDGGGEGRTGQGRFQGLSPSVVSLEQRDPDDHPGASL